MQSGMCHYLLECRRTNDNTVYARCAVNEFARHGAPLIRTTVCTVKIGWENVNSKQIEQSQSRIVET